MNITFWVSLGGCLFLALSEAPGAQPRSQQEYAELYPESNRAYQRALEATKVGDTGVALEAYGNAISSCPHGAHLYFERARLYLSASRADDAIKDYSEVIQLAPEMLPAACAGRAEAWLVKGEPQKAVEDSSAAVRAAPTLFSGYLCRARALDRLGDEDGADADYAEALRLNPRLPLECVSDAAQSIERQNWDHAIENYTILLRVQPTSVEGYWLRGNAHAATERWAQAIRDYSTAIAVSPGEQRTYLSRAFAYGETGEPDRMVTDVAKAMEITSGPSDDPHRLFLQELFASHLGVTTSIADPATHERAFQLCVRGALRVERRMIKRAREDFAEAAQLTPASAWPRMGRAYAAYWGNDRPGAIEELTEAIALDSACGYAHYLRGGIRLVGGDDDGAMMDLTAAIALDGNLAEAYYTRGSVHYARGSLDAALSDFTTAIQKNPTHRWAYGARANVYLKKGLHKEALVDYSHAVDLNPDPRLLIGRALVYRAIGLAENARADIKRAEELRSTSNLDRP